MLKSTFRDVMFTLRVHNLFANYLCGRPPTPPPPQPSSTNEQTFVTFWNMSFDWVLVIVTDRCLRTL